MIVAGAGGHALELLDILIANEMTDHLEFFDEFTDAKFFQEKYPILKTEEEVKAHFKSYPQFILGTGNPQVRNTFYQRFTALRGTHISVKGQGVAFSHFTQSNEADLFNLCFIGAKTQIGRGTLINTGAQIHHECRIGNFCDINPGAVLLGKAEIGDLTSIGSNATILPKIKIGRNVIVGAGSVVTHNVPDGVTVVGVPAKMI